MILIINNNLYIIYIESSPVVNMKQYHQSLHNIIKNNKKKEQDIKKKLKNDDGNYLK